MWDALEYIKFCVCLGCELWMLVNNRCCCSSALMMPNAAGVKKSTGIGDTGPAVAGVAGTCVRLPHRSWLQLVLVNLLLLVKPVTLPVAEPVAAAVRAAVGERVIVAHAAEFAGVASS
ncbi:hypothetical protein CYMTET_30807 [Cymbomonas tetramitiformis]|uniref:Uncharacterized protein n=1 Tax=Cymbomonas tetramitiformis TaxID=36881 RepID=A0AAE0KTI9_9CHLO|nr:hypothetical protein CYMTET_30807 [Cymbomonas tetramitiformis]